MLTLDLLFCKIKWAEAVPTNDMNRNSKKEAGTRILDTICCRIIREIPGSEIVWGRKLDDEVMGIKCQNVIGPHDSNPYRKG